MQRTIYLCTWSTIEELGAKTGQLYFFKLTTVLTTSMKNYFVKYIMQKVFYKNRWNR